MASYRKHPRPGRQFLRVPQQRSSTGQAVLLSAIRCREGLASARSIARPSTCPIGASFSATPWKRAIWCRFRKSRTFRDRRGVEPEGQSCGIPDGWFEFAKVSGPEPRVRSVLTNSPPQQEEGWPRHQEKYREASFDGADGVVVQDQQNVFEREPPPHLCR